MKHSIVLKFLAILLTAVSLLGAVAGGAGIIAMEPKCIVLDEPTAMLDPRGRREVMETINRLNESKGITVVLITHHMEEAAQADRVVVLHKGAVAADGTPAEVFSQVELLHDIGLV